MFEVQFRRMDTDDYEYRDFVIWSELGYFRSIKLAMLTILHELNKPHEVLVSRYPSKIPNETTLTMEEFEFSHIHTGHEVHRIYKSPDLWQFRFVEKTSPDNPWEIGLNDGNV